MTNTHKRPELSSVEREADRIDQNRARYEGYDARAREYGFDVTGEGRTGELFQAELLQPLNCPRFENVHRAPHAQEEMTSDVRAYRSAIHSSALVPVYKDREIYMTEWLAHLYRTLASVGKGRNIFGDHGIDEAAVKRFIKIVPCVHHRGMDDDRGVDCFVIFHDPEEFAKQKFGQNTDDLARESAREAMYWNSEKDTVVNIDVTANLGAKFSHSVHSGRTPRADIFVDKTGSATNHYLRQAVPSFPEQAGGTQHIRDAQARMHILAQRIIDAFEAKSGRLGGGRLDHLYSPERIVEHRLESARQQRHAAHMNAITRKQRDAKRKDQRRTQAERTWAKKANNVQFT